MNHSRRPNAILLSSTLLAFALSAACGGPRDAKLRLRNVVLYQNGLGYFEYSGRAQDDHLAMAVRRFELDDALKTMTVVSVSDGNASARHGTVHTMTGDDKGQDDEQRRVTMNVQIPDARGDALRVSYAVSTPIWKATYRVVFDATRDDEVLLQGWAAIQNTSGHDWKKVQLTLATGAPLSFGVNLSRPTYAQRPHMSGLTGPIALGAVRASHTQPGDQDADGIADRDDLCPSEPEDMDAFEDADGCPDPDNDHDRILDQDDLCPKDTETYNGLEDEDGCPDRGGVIVSEAHIEILDKIYFGEGASSVMPRSTPILDAVAATLSGNPHIARVEIAGHAATTEKEPWVLAEERAVAVAAYLVAQGVEKSRLQLRSFGQSMPIDNRANADAYARNRRVEFEIVGEQEQASTSSSSLASLQRSQQRVDVPSATIGGGMVRYQLPAEVSIADGESTLVPLINTRVEGEEIYLYRPEANLPGSDQHPSRAARIVNNGELALVPGPVAVFTHQAFAGEGLLETLHPGEGAFIPYALDRSATVAVTQTRTRQAKRIVAITKDRMAVLDEEQITSEYMIRPGLTPPRRAYVQHELHPGYALRDAPPGTEPSGKTTLAPIPIAAKRDSRLALIEFRETPAQLSISTSDASDIKTYLATTSLPRALAESIAEILKLRGEAQLERGKLATLREERFDAQIRAHEIRQNLLALARDQGALKGQLKKELSENEVSGRRLASRIAALSEAVSQKGIEVQERIATLSLEPKKD